MVTICDARAHIMHCYGPVRTLFEMRLDSQKIRSIVRWSAITAHLDRQVDSKIARNSLVNKKAARSQKSERLGDVVCMLRLAPIHFASPSPFCNSLPNYAALCLEAAAAWRYVITCSSSYTVSAGSIFARSATSGSRGWPAPGWPSLDLRFWD